MISAKELRIGNLLQCQLKPDGPWVTIAVKGISERFISWASAFDLPSPFVLLNDSYRPIPVTPEWLELLGFIDPVSNGWGRRPYLNESHELVWYLQDQQFYGESHVKYQTRCSGYSHDFGIKYVHQVQNLYFTLTGEELTIKETV